MNDKNKYYSRKIIGIYILLLIFHITHIFEEVLARFHVIDEVFGLNFFLLINLLLFCLPLGILYYLVREKIFAFYFAFLYAGIMIINGMAHIIATFLTGSYFGGYAGGISGTFMVITGFFLILYLRKKMISERNNRNT